LWAGGEEQEREKKGEGGEREGGKTTRLSLSVSFSLSSFPDAFYMGLGSGYWACFFILADFFVVFLFGLAFN
jgi:hypothetical protein